MTDEAERRRTKPNWALHTDVKSYAFAARELRGWADAQKSVSEKQYRAA